MAKGTVFNGHSPVTLRQGNTNVYTQGAWRAAKRACYHDGSKWVDLLGGGVPPVGTVLQGDAYGRVYYSGVSTGGCPFEPAAAIQAAGYSPGDFVLAGGSCRLSFTRGAEGNTGYWFDICLYREGAYVTQRNEVWAGDGFSFTVECARLSGIWSLAWSDAPNGGGGQGRNIEVYGFTIERI